MTRRILIGILIAVGALFIIAIPAFAAKIAITWVPPLTNTDGSPLTNLASYRLEWGTCDGSLFGVAQASISIPAGLTAASAYPTGINPVCVRIYAVNSAGVESEPSNTAKKTLPGPIQKPITLPKP